MSKRRARPRIIRDIVRALAESAPPTHKKES